mmetsp:Transcript_34991/g.84700  ORF Transcript_34991/g.84700 Transcript_34991/m.84700 type:complete len:366 (+) Transcript_34991:265-1362(+)
MSQRYYLLRQPSCHNWAYNKKKRGQNSLPFQLSSIRRKKERIDHMSASTDNASVFSAVTFVVAAVAASVVSINSICTTVLAEEEEEEEKPGQERRRLSDELDKQLQEMGLVDPDLALTYNHIARLLLKEGRLEIALELFEKRLEIEKDLFQRDDDPKMASTYRNIAYALLLQGKHQNAMQKYQKALDIVSEANGPSHISVGLTFENIGEALQHQGRHEEASHRFQQALAICRQNLGDNHPRVAMIYNSIAKDLVHSRGDQEAALDLLSKAAEIQLMNSREDHPDLAKIYITMADALKNQSKFRDAAKLYNKALAIRIKVFGKENRFVEEVFLKKFKLSSGRVPILGLVQNFELVRPDDNIARNDE